MPKLECLVKSCKYQIKGLCSARSIDVEDSSATCSDETKCGTFKYSTTLYDKSTHHTHEEISIHCDVAQCLHYNDHNCNAKEVEIVGDFAADIDGTQCASFLIK